MEKLFIFLPVIFWAVLQARRKAIRDQARKQSAQGRGSPAPMRERRAPRPPAPILGAVTAEENRELAPLDPTSERWAERAKQARDTDEVPKSIQNLLKERQKQVAPSADEAVEEIVAPASESPYEQNASAKTKISFTPDALRTFIVTREILGPARSRNPHRPGIRWR